MVPFVMLIGSLFLCQTLSKTLPCDGVEYTDNDGYTVMEAAGICLPTYYNIIDSYGVSNRYSGSTMKTCHSSDTNSILQKIWSTTDCSGSPMSTETWFGMSNYTNITVTCCSGNQCQYAKKIEDAQYVCVDGKTGVYPYVIGMCSKQQDTDYYDTKTIYRPAMYTLCITGELQYNYWSSDSFNCDDLEHLFTNGTLVNGNDYCNKWTITCHTAIDTCYYDPYNAGIIQYLGWFVFIALLLIYGCYEGINYIRSRCNKRKQVVINSDLHAHLNDNNELENDSMSEDEFVDTFKPSIFSLFLDIQDIINSSIFVVYFYENTGYKLDSAVGNVQILLFAMGILFKIIDLFVCIIWNFDLNVKCININRKLIVNYYKFKMVQCNFGFLKILFKLYYSFDYLYQNSTFYNIVFSLTMVFKSYWMLIIDFISKSQAQTKVKGIKDKILKKSQNALVQLFVITPLFYFVNSIILALEIMNNKIVMLVYCILWFISPWIYLISIKVNLLCGKCMKWFCGISQCFINTIMILIGIVGGIFVSIPQLQFYVTIIIYCISGIVVCCTCGIDILRREDKFYGYLNLSYRKILTCCCLVYALPGIIAIAFYSFDAIIVDINESDGHDEYDNNNENDHNYEPEYEPEIIPLN